VKLIPSYSFDCHYISDVKVLYLIRSIVKDLKVFNTSHLDGVEQSMQEEHKFISFAELSFGIGCVVVSKGKSILC
jgi:hypothetical protein